MGWAEPGGRAGLGLERDHGRGMEGLDPTALGQSRFSLGRPQTLAPPMDQWAFPANLMQGPPGAHPAACACCCPCSPLVRDGRRSV